MPIDQTKVGQTVAAQMGEIEADYDEHQVEEVRIHSSVSVVLIEDASGETEVRCRASEGCPPLTATAMLTMAIQMLTLMARQQLEALEGEERSDP
jgi:hypothetical protein